MKRSLRFPVLLSCFILSGMMYAQGVGINTSGNAPAEGAILDISSIDKAVLLPRTTTDNIQNPVEGMVIYDTTAHQFHYFNGLQWCALLEEGAYQFYWADEDGDGYGYPFNVIYSPDPPEFFVGNNDDCDDSDPNISPGANEICDGVDNDCDGLVDGDDPDIMDIPVSWLDADGDGFGDPAMEVMECPVPDGHVSNNLDCNDGDPLINPDAIEICDGIDNDCDDLVDFDDPDIEGAPTFYLDADDDGYGNPNVSEVNCDPPPGYVDNGLDCDDLDPDIFPGANEICDGIDNDCDGLVDGDDPDIVGAPTFYLDADDDGYGNPDASEVNCDLPPGYVDNNLDCNDLDPDIFPGANEICDGIDNDCDGEVDEDFDFQSDPNNCGSCEFVCNDNLDCTTDVCTGGECQTFINDGFCVINGQCYSNNEVNPEAPCEACLSAISQTQWTFLPDGTTCPGGFCNNGICE